MDNKRLGKIGENTAASVLTAKGYSILKENYRCKFGEIDIIAQKNSQIDFIEVKTRQNRNYGRPCESVTPAKQEHIKKAAYCYLRELKKHGYKPAKISFDIIEVSVEHIKSAF